MSADSKKTWNDFREIVEGLVGHVEFKLGDVDFDAQVEIPIDRPGIIGITTASPHMITSTKESVEQNHNNLVRIVVPKSGEVLLEQNDRRTVLQPGTFGVYDALQPVLIGAEKPFSHAIFSLPRDGFLDELGNLNDLTAVRFDRQFASNRLLLSHLSQLEQQAPELGYAGMSQFLGSVSQMLAVVLARSSERNQTLQVREFRELLERLKANLRDPDLSLEQIAAAEGQSVRSLNRLFHARGTTPWKWVTEARLQGAAADLRSSGEASRSVTDIAFSWGFNNASHFSRAFRNRFGMSARAWRNQ